MIKPREKTSIRLANEQAIIDAAEEVFAEHGFKGATTAEIACRARVPKANLHYYFPKKELLYRRVIQRVLTVWLAAASSFDENDDPADALARYIIAKMDMSRSLPLGSKIWANEIMRGAPIIQDYLETTLADWISSREMIVREWIAAGKLAPIEPRYLFYLIWASTQHYADFGHQVATLNGGAALSDREFQKAKHQVVEIILRGVVRE